MDLRSPMMNSPNARAAQRFCGVIAFIFSLFCVQVSCIVPLPIEQDQSEFNYPPTYEFFDVSPTPSGIIEYDPEIYEGAPLEFRTGPLIDPNLEDALFWRVFLNYQGRYYNPIHRSNRGAGLSPSLRAEGIQFQISPCLDFKLFSFELPYRVELIVSDRPFRQVEEESALINQILPADAESFRIHWFVRYTQALCPL